ncbi:hypothetical protein ACIOGZ_19600 [Kitasatospora sp. NPDC088160]|uniref:hypothetical protein n=1 Tax=Kitasatospora sp. NPDC088160 TaxID=3364072 RepID=UPI003826B608
MATPVGNGAPGAVVPARPSGPPGTAPAVPGVRGVPASGPGAAPARRPSAGPAPRGLSGLRARLANATRTAPGRLRLAGAVLAVLTVAFGALTAWQLETKAEAADRVVQHSQPLSKDAADIHRLLARADTTAATGFLLAGAETKTVRGDYEGDLASATDLITKAAAQTTIGSPAYQKLTELSEQLPVYAGLVETARANNRLGLPLGGAYLRYASEQMQGTLLPRAAELTAIENDELDKDYAEAKSSPWAAYGLGVLTLGALVWVQLTLFRRTNRVFNPGLLGATAAVLAGALWLAVTGLTTNAALQQSWKQGAQPLRALNTARVQVLSARLAENLNLVARGSTTAYADQWTTITRQLAGGEPANVPMEQHSGSLRQALDLAPADARQQIGEADRQYGTWRTRHDAAHTLETQQADYQGALQATVTADPAAEANTADGAFKATDKALDQAATTEQDHFERSAKGTEGDLRLAALAAALLGVVAAAAALRGLGRRLAEYR